MTTDKILENSHEYFGHLPESVLFDLARNDAADYRVRVAAVEIMVEKNYTKANHPELSAFLAEVKSRQAARAEVLEAVETAAEIPAEEWIATSE